ncbi:MAG TPA: ATP-binding cassette domain-containing protein [Saprospiraceae bacterium]|nr:ATP-binding cassette domain-containing protein [Saprospiraceae bacterium]
MTSAILDVEGLTLVSDQGSIVRQLSFQVNRGEIVALTGASGSGKTSIALAILNLLPRGIIFHDGIIRWSAVPQDEMKLPDDAGSWHHLRGTHIGYIQQDIFGAFDPVMTMGNQMMLIIRERMKRVDTDIEKELRIKMEEVGLHETERLLASFPHQLSGGQLQRCQIAMAIVIRPELLIADEPTSAIDKINQLELLDVFAMLKSRYHMAILCITHEEAVVRHLADREIKIGSIDADYTLPPPQNRHAGTSVEVPLLEVKELEYTHSFGGMRHKRGATVGFLDFKLHHGTCLGIVGESGSGKSTLAQLLVGLFIPRHGKVILEGKVVDFQDLHQVRKLRSEVQLVMQDGRGSLHPNMAIREILEEIKLIRTRSGKPGSNSLKEVLREVGLEESVLDRKSGQLSGGECLRVSIARALLMHPSVLICDESTSSLDGPTRDGIIELLLRLMHERGLSLIFISHDEWIIRGIADQVMVLDDGKIVEIGSATDVIGYPTHPVSKRIFAPHATFGHTSHP